LIQGFTDLAAHTEARSTLAKYDGRVLDVLCEMKNRVVNSTLADNVRSWRGLVNDKSPLF
jgi:hypothetical protein